MPPRHACYLALCAAIIGWALGFALSAFVALPVLWYYPLTHQIALEVRPSALAMDWYGRSLLAALIGASAFALAYPLTRRLPSRWATPRLFGLWAAWAATAVLLSAGLYTFQLIGRPPSPEPLPPSYAPR